MRHALGDIRSGVQRGLTSPDEAAVKVVDVVEAFGLRAVEPPRPVEFVTEDHIGVACWMVVLPPT